MASNWTSLLTVVLVATGCTVGVVVLVCLALLGLSARAVSSAPAGGRSLRRRSDRPLLRSA